jgi:F-type H+-transporting ATPase subunit b
MPQIAQIGEIYASQLFWLVIVFGLIFTFVGLGMMPKIQGTVDARNQRIAADLAEAQAARESADALEQAYRDRMDESRAEATRLASKAKAESARATEGKVAEAGTAIGARVEAAQARIAEVRASAMSEIEAVAADATRVIVERVAALNVDEAAVRSAVAVELANG